MKHHIIKTLAAVKVQNTLLAFLIFIVQTGATAQSNTGLEFNGTNGHANLGTVNPAGNFSGGITIEAWVKWNSFNTWSRIFELGNGAGSNNILFANEANTGRLRYEVYVGGTTQGLSSAAALVTGRWYHVAVSQTNTGTTTLYVDGIATATGTVQLPLNIARTMNYIGRSNWSGDGYLNARVDDIRIWNTTRSAAEIRQNMEKPVAGNSPGLVANYQLSEGSGATITNVATNGGAGDGTLTGTYAWISTPMVVAPNSISLDGTNDHINIGQPLAAGSSYTKEAWVYVTKSTTSAQNIISSNRSPFWISGSYLRAGNNLSTAQVIDADVFPANTWVHVAVTYDNTAKLMRLYRNGLQVASATVNEAYQDQSNFAGAWFNGSGTESFLGGNIDDIRIWNSARTASEISAFMNREVNAANEPNLVAYYTFNQGSADNDNTGYVTVPSRKGLSNATLVNLALSGTASNYDQQNASIVVLPVSFGEFNLKKQAGNILLEWSTISEANSLRFVAEHSINGKDWKDVGARAAAGNSNARKNYSLVHASPAKGLNYYRIAQVDKDNRTSYSAVRTISTNDKGKLFAVINSPVTNRLVQVHVNTNTTLSLYNPDGRLIWTKEFAAGLQQFSIDGAAKGIYYLNGKGATERIVVQ